MGNTDPSPRGWFTCPYLEVHGTSQLLTLRVHVPNDLVFGFRVIVIVV